jgi:hypothetical protein
MRDLTGEELDALNADGRCPFCYSRNLNEGPQGGLMTNWYCECGAGFNLPPMNIPMGGQLIQLPDAHVKAALSHEAKRYESDLRRLASE